jgi:hypothetical protein
MADPGDSSLRIYFHDTAGRLARVSWCPSAAAARAAIEDASPPLVQARVVWPDESWRVLSRSVVGGPWTPGPRVRPAVDAMRESA